MEQTRRDCWCSNADGGTILVCRTYFANLGFIVGIKLAAGIKFIATTTNARRHDLGESQTDKVARARATIRNYSLTYLYMSEEKQYRCRGSFVQGTACANVGLEEGVTCAKCTAKNYDAEARDAAIAAEAERTKDLPADRVKKSQRVKIQP